MIAFTYKVFLHVKLEQWYYNAAVLQCRKGLDADIFFTFTFWQESMQLRWDQQGKERKTSMGRYLPVFSS